MSLNYKRCNSSSLVNDLSNNYFEVLANTEVIALYFEENEINFKLRECHELEEIQ
jgi:hypothetical protein